MGVSSLLFPLLVCVQIILLACYSIFILLLQQIFRLQARNLPIQWPDCSFLTRHHMLVDHAMPLSYAKLSIHSYVRGIDQVGEHAECVFCLCEIEEGEEIRKLSCMHLFHRACLDTWFKYRQHATCPLCRAPLVLFDGAMELGELEEDELDDPTLPLMAYVYRLIYALGNLQGAHHIPPNNRYVMMP